MAEFSPKLDEEQSQMERVRERTEIRFTRMALIGLNEILSLLTNSEILLLFLNKEILILFLNNVILLLFLNSER